MSFGNCQGCTDVCDSGSVQIQTSQTGQTCDTRLQFGDLARPRPSLRMVIEEWVEEAKAWDEGRRQSCNLFEAQCSLHLTRAKDPRYGSSWLAI